MKKYDEEAATICGASAYQQKFYLNPAYEKLPQEVKNELQILCVSFVEDVGGVLTIAFDEDGRPQFIVRAAKLDPAFDEIGSELKIKQLQAEKAELMEQLTLFYRFFILGEDPGESPL